MARQTHRHSRRERDYWLALAESQRAKRQWERERETLGSRALSAQIAEFACGSDAGELAELFAWRLAGDVSA
jgi:hypothetical protein